MTILACRLRSISFCKGARVYTCTGNDVKTGNKVLKYSYSLFCFEGFPVLKEIIENNNFILIMTPEKQDKTLDLSKHSSVDSTPARNEVIMKMAYPVESVKCDKICSNY